VTKNDQIKPTGGGQSEFWNSPTPGRGQKAGPPSERDTGGAGAAGTGVRRFTIAILHLIEDSCPPASDQIGGKDLFSLETAPVLPLPTADESLSGNLYQNTSYKIVHRAPAIHRPAAQRQEKWREMLQVTVPFPRNNQSPDAETPLPRTPLPRRCSRQRPPAPRSPPAARGRLPGLCGRTVRVRRAPATEPQRAAAEWRFPAASSRLRTPCSRQRCGLGSVQRRREAGAGQQPPHAQRQEPGERCPGPAPLPPATRAAAGSASGAPSRSPTPRSPLPRPTRDGFHRGSGTEGRPRPAHADARTGPRGRQPPPRGSRRVRDRDFSQLPQLSRTCGSRAPVPQRKRLPLPRGAEGAPARSPLRTSVPADRPPGDGCTGGA